MAYGTEKAKEKKDISKQLQLFLFFFFSQLCSGTCKVCLQQLRAKDPRVFISAAFLQRMWIPLLYLRLLQIFNPNRFFLKRAARFATACELLWIRRGDWKPDDSTFVGLVIYVLCKSECFLRTSSGQLLLWRYRKWPHSSVDVWPNNYFPEDFVVLIVSFKSCIFVLFCYVCFFLRKVLKIRYALGRPIPYGVQCSSVRYICNSSCPVSKCQNGNDKNINLEALKLFFLYPCPLCPSLSVTHYFH